METISVRSGTRLDQVLKLANLVGSGGEAKVLIQDGAVTVNSRIEIRRGHKVQDGDLIELDGNVIKIAIVE